MLVCVRVVIDLVQILMQNTYLKCQNVNSGHTATAHGSQLQIARLTFPTVRECKYNLLRLIASLNAYYLSLLNHYNMYF